MKIEHTHGDTTAKESGAWTLDVARMLYEKQNDNDESDNNALPKEDTDKFTANAEIPQENTAEDSDQQIFVTKPADELDDMNNEIVDYDNFITRESTEIYIAPVTSYPIPEDLPVGKAIYDTADDYSADEVVLDPDNFEYFKGVCSNSSEPNFENR